MSTSRSGWLLVLGLVVGAVSATDWPPGAGPDTPLLVLRRATGESAQWDLQFVDAPTSSAATCVEGRRAWDETYLYTCVPGGHWVRVEPDKIWEAP